MRLPLPSRAAVAREAYADGFRAGVAAMLDHVRTRAPGGDPVAEAEAFAADLAKSVDEAMSA